MYRLLTNQQMRKADEYTIKTLGYPSKTLMQRAGKAIADEVLEVYHRINAKSVLVVCGNGNNGGDGYVAATALLNKKLNVKVFAFSGSLSADCEREKLNYVGEYTNKIKADIIVDCIFGTGLSREVQGEYVGVINEINQSGAFVISADIPSGLNGDNGSVLGVAVKANLTVAIAEFKIGHFFNDGKDYCGALVKKDIGISLPEHDYVYVLEDANVKALLPARKQNSNKGTYGTANIIAGSSQYPGAAVLAVSTALKSGCGYVNLTCPDFIKNALFAAYPQIVYSQAPSYTANCVAFGMGLGQGEQTCEALYQILKKYQGNLIIDADGLNVLSQSGVSALKNKNCRVLITPHVKEFSRLTGFTVAEILSNPLRYAQNFAKEYGVTVLLKGTSTLITDGEQTAVNVRGSSALAKAGSGDMLSGLICGLTAQGVSLFNAALIGSYLLGVSAEISQEECSAYAVTSTQLINNLSNAYLRLTN